MKMTNIIFLPFVFLIKKEKFKTNVGYLTFVSLVILSGIVSAVLWNHAFPFIPSEYWATGASASDAVSYIISNPMQALSRIVSNSYSQFPVQMINIFAYFGGGPAPFNWIFSGVYIAIFFFIVAVMISNNCSEIKIPSGKFDIVLVFTVTITSYYIIFIAFFIGYSPLSSTVITGIQGRYFNLSIFCFVILSYLFVSKHGLDVKYARIKIPINILSVIAYAIILCLIAYKSIHNYHQIYS